jgi:hypothetical protein
VPQNSKSKDPTLLETHTFDVPRILETWKFAVSFLHGDRLERLERSEAVERLERLERAFRLPRTFLFPNQCLALVPSGAGIPVNSRSLLFFLIPSCKKIGSRIGTLSLPTYTLSR